MNSKLKHLEMLQAVITRMAHNSFLLKGWSVTLVAAILALAAKNTDRRLILVALPPVIIFWALDAFFLHQERLFRALYDSVRLKSEAEVDFSMNTQPFAHQVATWPQVGRSNTLLIFHGAILFTVVMAVIFL
jgi:hypothetical protein